MHARVLNAILHVKPHLGGHGIRLSQTVTIMVAACATWRSTGKSVDSGHLAGRGGGSAAGFTMLTTEPGADIALFHDRQVVALMLRDWPASIYLTRPESELLRPLPPGSLTEETVSRGAA